MNRKSLSRIAAVQVMYSYEFCKTDTDISTKLNEIIELYKSKFIQDYYKEINDNNHIKLKLSVNYLNDLVYLTYKNLETIDKEISHFLKEENIISEMYIISLIILRVAFAEIMYFKDVPAKVLISDYTNIAGQMLDIKKTGFINSVLHNYKFQGKDSILL